ncbi:hypothetical protein [Erythrobacter sp. WG]|uniref:hypothetical protein n=1 Tax=Erythrobacter sp. WG TaxID=2985510 RepID=UPI00226E98BC|nr:hypothetical protein [Erythrobacter sp. WG]MCX9148369.1 hypothetical protein [Erythrobacter sp. WG]
MTSVIEAMAAQMGWQIGRATVIVEGTSDVAYLTHASKLYTEAYGQPVIDSDFGVAAAGHGDDGGVDGVNRMLVTMRQNARLDLDEAGRTRFRFGGLFDKDHAGTTAFNLASRFDPSVQRYRDIFLLQPVMPEVGDGTADRMLEATRANLRYSQLDWEIEDICSESFLQRFERRYPDLAPTKQTVHDRTHRNYTRGAKRKLLEEFRASASLNDALGMVKLIKCLRGYMGVPFNHIQT